MKLFDNFEAVKFTEENLIFVTKGRYIYYIYDPKYKNWKKYKNSGYDCITVNNYQDVSKEEIMNALGGILPQKETDFTRRCDPSELYIIKMLDLLKEDYPDYMSNDLIYYASQKFLDESDIRHRSYYELRKLFDNADSIHEDNENVINQIQKLSFDIIGRDIFKREIGIVDGHDSSSYFWIMPVRVIDYADSNGLDSVAKMKSSEISIEEDDVAQYLTPFLYKYYDDELEANKKRVKYWNPKDKDGNIIYTKGFEWYLTHNFYTHQSIMNMLADIRDTIEALSSGRENEFTAKLRKKRGTETYKLLYSKNMTQEQIDEYNANIPKEDDTPVDLIIDFYRRFIYRMEYMLRVGSEKGYNLISFMGP
ncbi:MAG: hypothetical protein IJT21_09570 [Synergistaceae bacterium]|nr:hypothetical protein [Synergistaceae bacterium]